MIYVASRYRKRGRAGWNKISAKFVNAQEMMEKVVEISNIRGWRLNEIYLEKSSLDAIFAELSKK